ncbi:unnamed protein product [Cylindrotheca closterium]|uniref:Pentacotripeptide-repeat region of PRORP domain-containing protein n=1 Tax=Cylindrotheca closterium TaxID=2856 RepID=A0AAD2FX10_9STRA|nr:unnamed protein product [Cylindrotheca closterium]
MCSPSASLLVNPLNSNQHIHGELSVCQLATNSNLQDPASRFHRDMLRVLDSRQNMSPADHASSLPIERKKRPNLLTSDIDGVERVVSMLEHMVEIGVATEESFQIALEGLSNRGRLRWRRASDSAVVCAADEVEPLLKKLWDDKNGTVSTKTCNFALKAYAACSTPRGDRMYAQKAEAVVVKMQETGIDITSETLAHLVHAWAWQQENRDSGECVKRAQHYFDEMMKLSPDEDTVFRGYELLLEAWSKCSSSSAAESSERIFSKMKQLRGVNVGAQQYSNAILALAKQNGEENAEKANSLLLQMIDEYEASGYGESTRPELIAINGVIAAWSRCRRIDKSEEVLWLASDLGKTCEDIYPDVVTFNGVLHAYIRHRDRSKSLDKMIKIIDYMEANSKEHPVMKPDGFTYNTLLKAWVQSNRKDAVEEAEKVLFRMQEASGILPTSRHYNVVINALAKCRNPDAHKAYNLLRQLQALDSYTPDIITYTSVIECCSKSSDPHAAEIGLELFEEANDLYRGTGDKGIMPNLFSYTVTIRALSTNPTPENVRIARDLLEKLVATYAETLDDSLCPTTYPFNYVINCAANCVGSHDEKLRAFKIAAKTYNEIRSSEIIQPDSFTYAFWFKCCNNLLPEGDIRTKGLTFAFEQCKRSGLVSSEALRRLLAGTPSKLATSLLGIPFNTSPLVYRQYTLEDFPPGWSRNVRKDSN